MSRKDVFGEMTAEEAARFMTGGHSAQGSRDVLARMSEGLRVLDIGCGRGIRVQELYASSKYLGVDVSPELIKLARLENPQHQFMAGDAACGLPFTDGEWDVVQARSVLEHLPTLECALRTYDEMLRIAKRFVLVSWHTPPGPATTKLKRVPAELDEPIPQNRYYFGCFLRPQVSVTVTTFEEATIWLAKKSC